MISTRRTVLKLESYCRQLVLSRGFYKWKPSLDATPQENQSLEGKTAIITGASGGIGLETAAKLAETNARVVLACRDVKQGESVRERIISATGNEQVVVRHIDLSSMKSVRHFCKEFLEMEQRVDILINNAGVFYKEKKEVTEDGLEYQMATNYFGPFLLTNILLGVIKKCAPSRIVNVSSLIHNLGKLDFDNINAEKKFDTKQIYATSKLCNILFTNELGRRMKDAGVTCNSLHPGIVNTGISRSFPGGKTFFGKLFMETFFKTPQQGAETSVYLAVSDDVKNVTGRYFHQCKEEEPSSAAQDLFLQQKLWEISVELTGLQLSEMHC